MLAEHAEHLELQRFEMCVYVCVIYYNEYDNYRR